MLSLNNTGRRGRGRKDGEKPYNTRVGEMPCLIYNNNNK
jgi:hypothetical protein